MKETEDKASFLSRLKGIRERFTHPRKGINVISAEYAPQDQVKEEEQHLRTLGTFGGVFTPSFLTIIGVIMYLRFSWIIANAGLYHTLIIVVLANCITFITALSVSSIGSNERMETGGAYYMINRVLGFLPGGAIGIPLYISQALSIALYIIGFSETLSGIFPSLDVRLTALITLAALSLLGLVGTRFMVRIQYAILALIILSFISIAAGFSPHTAVLLPAYSADTGFWRVFAVFFPAVTGILSGVSMSGDLKDPAKSIPRGTMGAVAAGIYYLPCGTPGTGFFRGKGKSLCGKCLNCRLSLAPACGAGNFRSNFKFRHRITYGGPQNTSGPGKRQGAALLFRLWCRKNQRTRTWPYCVGGDCAGRHAPGQS